MLAFLCLAVLMLIACALSVLRTHRATLTLPPHTQDNPNWAAQAYEALARAERTAPAPPTLALATALTLAVALYALLGTWHPEALKLPTAAQSPTLNAHNHVPPREDAKHPGDNLLLDDRITALKARLQAAPNDLNGWVLFARSHAIARNFTDSANAFEKALTLAPGHPDLLADLADVLAMTQNKNLAGRPTALINQALQADPSHPKALQLAATAAIQRQDKPAARQLLTRLRKTLPPDAPEIPQIDDILKQLLAQ